MRRNSLIILTFLTLFLFENHLGFSSTIYIGGANHIGKVDTATGNITIFPDLELFNGYIRTLTFDESGRLWGSVAGAGFGEFDINTGTFSLLGDLDNVTSSAIRPIPEPATLLLLGLGLLGVAGVSRRKK